MCRHHRQQLSTSCLLAPRPAADFKAMLLLGVQVKYGAGYKAGIGLGAGEDGEQLFATLSRFAPTTRLMTVAGSLPGASG